jgi:hypothetical protein
MAKQLRKGDFFLNIGNTLFRAVVFIITNTDIGGQRRKSSYFFHFSFFFQRDLNLWYSCTLTIV